MESPDQTFVTWGPLRELVLNAWPAGPGAAGSWMHLLRMPEGEAVYI